MPGKVDCALHGERHEAFVCSHLVGNPAGLGFHRDEPTTENPFPDAWCNDCEIIREAHGGWTEESEKLLKISLLCSACYERARIRNTKTPYSFDDLAGVRWKCGSCDEWHTGPCLDFGFPSPLYWREKKNNARFSSPPEPGSKERKTFLTPDFCAIEDEQFYVRGVLLLPIIGTAENLCWGVWGSLSRDNFQTLLNMDNDPKRSELPPMFSWLSSRIPEYPDTLSLKMYAHIQKPGSRPHFELQETDHPLSQEYHHGITAERVRDIMLRHLREAS